MQISFANKHIFSLEDVDSTNSYASTLPVDTPEGSIVVANFQTKGRGQGQNYWESEKDKNLTFSILLKPVFVKAVNQFYLSKIVSLAMADLISMYAGDVKIKWPNDIYVKDKKIAGILIENSIESDFISHCIIGIGLNINQEIFLSEAPNPVSLKQITGETYETSEILDIFSDILEYRYKLLSKKDYTTIDQNYLDFMYLLHKEAEYKSENELFNGKITGVAPTGELLITTNEGLKRSFWYKEVAFIQ